MHHFDRERLHRNWWRSFHFGVVLLRSQIRVHKRQIRKCIYKVLQLSPPAGVFCDVSQVSGLLVYLCISTHHAINCPVYVLRFLGIRPKIRIYSCILIYLSSCCRSFLCFSISESIRFCYCLLFRIAGACLYFCFQAICFCMSARLFLRFI